MSSVSHVWPRADGEDRGRRRIGDHDETPLKINGIDELKSGGVMVTSELSFEREGGDKPVCVAETLMLAYAS
jgi:hypothetical protein